MIYSEIDSHRLFNQDFEEFFEYSKDFHKVSQDILRINNELQDKIKFWKGGSEKLAKDYCIVTDYCWDPVGKRIEGFPNRFHLSYPIERKSSKFIIRLAKLPNVFKTSDLRSVEDMFKRYNSNFINHKNQFIYLFNSDDKIRLIKLEDVYNDSFAKNIFQPAVIQLANQMNLHSIQPDGVSFIDVFINNYFTFDEYLTYSNKSLNDAVDKMLCFSKDGCIIQTASQLNRDNLRKLVRLMLNKDKKLSEENEVLIATFIRHVMFSKFSKTARAYSNEEKRWLKTQLRNHIY